MTALLYFSTNMLFLKVELFDEINGFLEGI